MGVDIHMSIISAKDGSYLANDIFEGRNSRWFGNLMGDGEDDVYDHFEPCYGIPEKVPADIKEDFEGKDGYYGFRYITIRNFKIWYEKYQPALKAGWVPTFIKWAYEKKNIIPDDEREDEVCPRLNWVPEEERCDRVFLEYIDRYEPSLWLYEYVTKGVELDNRFTLDDIIIFYFDR